MYVHEPSGVLLSRDDYSSQSPLRGHGVGVADHDGVRGAGAALGGSGPQDAPPPKTAAVSRAPFGKMTDGGLVEIFTLTSAGGLEVRTMPYGATIVSIRVPDRSGRVADVALGFDTFDE